MEAFYLLSVASAAPAFTQSISKVGRGSETAHSIKWAAGRHDPDG
jgi:hypothetical protein